MAGKKVLSIDIGVLTTRIVEIDYKKEKPHIYNVATFDTPDGAVEDGFIRNREILSVAMKAALADSGIRNKSVVFTMSSTKIANREVVIPMVPDNKIKGVVDANAKDYFPVDIEQYIVSYTILERLKSEKNLRLLVLAAPNLMIESYYDFAQMMGFDIVALDYVGNSALQILKKQTAEIGITLSVQINQSNSLINIMNGETLLLQRTVPYGVSQVVETVLNTGEFEAADNNEAWQKLTSATIINSKLDESGVDAEAYSYMESNDDSYAQQLRVMKAKDDITATLSYLINNVIRVIDYYQAKNTDAKIDKVLLCGPGSRISGLSTLFRNEIFIEVDVLENLYSVDFERAVMVDNLDKCMFMSAVGAAINPVDFIPKEHQVIAKKKNDNKYLMMASLGIIAVGAFFAVIGVGKYTVKKATLNSREKEAKSLEQYETLYNDYTKAKADSESISGLYRSTLNTHSVVDVFFKEFETYFANTGTVISGISSDGEKASIDIDCPSEDSVVAIIEELRKMQTVSAVNTWSWSKEVPELEDGTTSVVANSVITLSIELTYNQDIDYDKIITLIGEGKTFDEAINEVYGIIGSSEDKSDNNEDKDN